MSNMKLTSPRCRSVPTANFSKNLGLRFGGAKPNFAAYKAVASLVVFALSSQREKYKKDRPYNILLSTVKMSCSVSTTTNGVVVITHVHPAGNGLGMGASSPTCMGRVGPVVSSVMERFREGHPKALGTVQIMVGAMTFLFGIVMAVGCVLNLTVIFGFFVWGSIIYIIAGSLTIAAEKSLNKCLVKASLGMNVVATVTAGIGTFLYSVDFTGVFLYFCGAICEQYWGIAAIMVLFSLLEMMVSISVSVFACKALCHSPPEQAFIVDSYLPEGGPVPVPSKTTFNIPPNKMSSSVSTTTNGVVVITHVQPAGNGLGMGAPSPPTCMGRVGPVVSSVMERFREGHPKALGTVQIMVGAITFLFGIVMAVGELSLGGVSGIFVWGSIIYIIAGSLTIAAEKSLNKCLVKASLGMNVVATVTAVIGTVLYSVDAAGVFHYWYFYHDDERCMVQQQGISGIMVLSLCRR